MQIGSLLKELTDPDGPNGPHGRADGRVRLWSWKGESCLHWDILWTKSASDTNHQMVSAHRSSRTVQKEKKFPVFDLRSAFSSKKTWRIRVALRQETDYDKCVGNSDFPTVHMDSWRFHG